MKSAMHSGHEGALWRFLVACDPQVDCYIVRDVDSPPCGRDRQMADEWLASGRDFHIIRDHPQHATLILAGLWGAVGFSLADFLQHATLILAGLWGGRKQIAGMDSMVESYISNHAGQEFGYGLDQIVLSHHLYRKIRRSVRIHSSWIRCPFELTLPSPPFLREESFMGAHHKREDMIDMRECRNSVEMTKKSYREKQLIASRSVSDIFSRKITVREQLIARLLDLLDRACLLCGIYPFFAGYKKKSL